MKALCTGITSTGEASLLFLSSPYPEANRYYTLEDATEGTNAQNKAFHALVQEYWKSGLHSYDARGFGEFRDFIKRDLGAGFDQWFFATIENGKPRARKARKYDEIPAEIREDPDRREMIFGRLKSWSNYTKKQRRETIDRLMAEMDQAGVNSRKYNEIREGMAG